MSKKKSETTPSTNVQVIPTVNEDSTALGEIKINHKVVANIVQLAALDVAGVVSVVGNKIVDKIEGIFSKKDAGAGIRVEEDENGNYLIGIHVILSFGVELAKTAYEIQKTVRNQVSKMTNKKVAKVDVVIEGIKMPTPAKEESEKDDWHEAQPTD